MFAIRRLWGVSAVLKPKFMQRSRRDHRGFTIVELLVGILVGLIVVAGAIAVYITVVRGGNYLVREARVNQELRVAMDLMVNDIRRSGYWRDAEPFDPSAPGAGAVQFNPFMNRDPAEEITDIHILGGGACILFSYDPTFNEDNGTIFGYRLVGNVIQALLDPDVVETDDCTAGGWQPITDGAAVLVDTLTFDFTNSRCLNVTAGRAWETTAAGATEPVCIDSAAWGTPAPNTGDVLIESRQVNIALTGRHAADDRAILNLAESVTVRNNRILASPAPASP
jgi:prepilin peptidase dependent protein B